MKNRDHANRKFPFWAPYALFTISLLLLLAVLTGIALHQNRRHDEERARVSAENLARLLDGQVSSLFGRINLLLQYIADDYRRGAFRHEEAERFLVRHRARIPEVASLHVFDGRSGGRAGAAVDHPFLDSCRSARDAAGTGLLVSDPYRDRRTGTWLITLARRLETADGTTAGVVCAQVPVTGIEEIFAALQVGPASVIALLNDDLKLVARRPRTSAPSGGIGSVLKEPALRSALRARPERGGFHALSPVDKLDRQYIYERVGGYPLYIFIDLAQRDIHHGLGLQVALQVGLALVAGTVIVVTAWLAHRSARRRRQAEQGLAESEERWELALDGAGHGVWDWHIQSGVTHFSDNWKKCSAMPTTRFFTMSRSGRRSLTRMTCRPSGRLSRTTWRGRRRITPRSTACAARTAAGNGFSIAAWSSSATVTAGRCGWSAPTPTLPNR